MVVSSVVSGANNRPVDRMKEDPRAIEALGKPIENRLWRDDTTFDFKGRGRLRARFTVVGPKGEGRLELGAHFDRRERAWRLDRLLLHVDESDDPIDLLEETAPPGDASAAGAA